MSQVPGKQVFKVAKAGEPLTIRSASEHNKITRAISGLYETRPTGRRYQPIKIIRLTQPVGVDQDELSEGHKQDGVVQAYSPATNSFSDGTDTETKTEITDVYGLVYDDDQIIFGMYSEESGQFHPINGITVRHAITTQDATGYYPPRSLNPDTYPVKFIKIAYAEAAGRQGHSLTYLDSGVATPASPDNDDYAHNLYDIWHSDNEAPCIPEGTIIWCYHVTGQWFTYLEGLFEDSSSSLSTSASSMSASSDQSSASSISASSPSSGSSSASSSGSSSDSSSGSSSGSSASSSGSSGSSSGSSSGGSSGSSSVSTSDSSISTSDSSLSTSESSPSTSDSSVSTSGSSISTSGSSVSTSESSGFDCINVVTDVQFDGVECVLTVCTTQICFPKSLGVVIHPESC